MAAGESDASSVLIIDWFIRERHAVIQSMCRAQVSRLDEEKNALVARASQFQSSCMALGAQLKEARDRWQATCLTNAALQRELMALRAQAHEWQVRPPLSRLHRPKHLLRGTFFACLTLSLCSARGRELGWDTVLSSDNSRASGNMLRLYVGLADAR